MTKEGPAYFPPAMAVGTFKLDIRVHTGNANRTICEGIYVFDVKMAKMAGLGGMFKAKT